ncbi:hypothetical protein [Rhizobium laguerreae]|uniref:hypothetical protein n=1 Tax=Rhizobium laguerreae TaxID=1076926 RepID=UPI001C91676A|nr:hypothetical protein [Rhizobium laguerreae]MBY3441619.1 hypothetical protein [Rhizobium laguerreae]
MTVVANFFRNLRDNNHIDVLSVDDLDIAIATSFLRFVENQKQKSLKTDFYRLLLRAIGIPPHLVPPNPYPRERVTNPVLYDDRQTRAAVKTLKCECEVVIKRVKTLQLLLGTGKDPRKEHGGKKGDWEKPENGIFIATQVVGISLISWDDMNASDDIADFRSIMHGLNKCPGAPYVNDNGGVSLEKGWRGQIRWFHPYADDIAPFVVLTMIRTGVNFSAIARVKSGKKNWSEPYPFTVGGSPVDQYVFMVFEKDRGTDPDDDDEGPNIRVVSSTRPYSHPYRVFEFVEQLTAPLRAEMHNEITQLKAINARSEKEQQRLLKLERIKDDLFIYRTKSTGFGSLADYADTAVPEAIKKCLLRCKLQTNIRHLRSLKINFAYTASGNNLFVSQLLAHHRTASTSLFYIRRKATLERHYELFQNIFSLSISLINSNKFTYESLRITLETQGFVGETLDNLMNPEYRTRWGNNCATPYNPPSGFNQETPPGELCRCQNCIDGCPSARWFYDAVSIVEKQHATLCARRERVGLISIEGSSLPSQIERCETLLGAWKAAA